MENLVRRRVADASDADEVRCRFDAWRFDAYEQAELCEPRRHLFCRVQILSECEPTATDEIDGLANYLDQQLAALRASAIGLTEEQVRMRPCRSALSIGGLLKHATYGMEGATRRLRSPEGAPPAIDDDAYDAYMGSFALTDDESGQGALDAFDRARTEYVAAVRESDPAAATIEPPSPWFGIFGARPANPATTWSTRWRRWPATPATPTSSARRSTACRSRRSS